MQYKKSNK